MGWIRKNPWIYPRLGSLAHIFVIKLKNESIETSQNSV